MRNNRGFSLMEVLIVLIILGVLAGLAVPVFITQVERSRASEAIGMLEAARGSMLRFFATNGTYAGAIITAVGVPGTTIDFNPNVESSSGGQVPLFSYVVGPAVPGIATFTITATRIAKAGAPVPAGGPHTVSIDQTGAIARSAVYV